MKHTLMTSDSELVTITSLITWLCDLLYTISIIFWDIWPHTLSTHRHRIIIHLRITDVCSDWNLQLQLLLLKMKLSKNFLSPKICQILTFYGAYRTGGMQCGDFYSKRHILAWIHVVWRHTYITPFMCSYQGSNRDSCRNDAMSCNQSLDEWVSSLSRLVHLCILWNSTMHWKLRHFWLLNLISTLHTCSRVYITPLNLVHTSQLQ